jgi:hypothetical protein
MSKDCEIRLHLRPKKRKLSYRQTPTLLVVAEAGGKKFEKTVRAKITRVTSKIVFRCQIDLSTRLFEQHSVAVAVVPVCESLMEALPFRGT